ncbi:starch binding domain-containing protein [Chloropicon primus]|nr:starch binding domain-containing protein [Chloropicon primus]
MERAARARRWGPKGAVLRDRPALRGNGLARASQAEAKTWKEGYWGTTARQQNGEGRDKLLEAVGSAAPSSLAWPSELRHLRSGTPQSFLKLKSKAKEKHNRMHYLSTSPGDSAVLSVPQPSTPAQSVEFALNSNSGVRLDEIEEDIDRLYAGLEKMVEESRKTNQRVNRAVATSSGQSEKVDTERLERDLSIVNEEQRNSRQLLSELERKLEEVSRGATEQENKMDSHVEKTTEGFQDAIEALGIMKEKIENFESKLEQLEHWGSGSTDTTMDTIAERLDEVEKERWVYLESAAEQTKRIDEFGRVLEDLSDKSSFLSDEVKQLKLSTEETKGIARESGGILRDILSREVSASARRDPNLPDLGEAPAGVNDAAGLGDQGKEETTAMELEVASIKEALESTQQGMRRLEKELSEVRGSVQTMVDTNRFSIFLRKFYIALQKHLEENALSLQDVFSKYDRDKDGSLAGGELVRMLEDLLPDSREDERKSLVFFLDPLAEGRIHYGKVLQNTSNVSGKSGGFHTVKFTMKYFTPPNQHIRICGAHEDLGWWSVLEAPRLYEVEHGSWEATLSLPGSTLYEYKYVVCDNDEALEWLPGSNLVLELPPGQPLETRVNGNGSSARKEIVVKDKWNAHPSGEPLSSTVNTRSNILRMLSAVGSPQDLSSP